MPPRHRFLEPIYNVKDEADGLYRGEPRIGFLFNPGTEQRSHAGGMMSSGSIALILVLDRAPHGLCARLVEPIGIEPMTSSLQS